jgi:mgtE-like transporter
VFAIVVFSLVGLSAEIISAATGRASPGLAAMVGVSLFAGFLATIIATTLAYYTAVATFRFGFDPDNFGIPIGSSLMDLAGTVCLILAILTLGISPHG